MTGASRLFGPTPLPIAALSSESDHRPIPLSSSGVIDIRSPHGIVLVGKELGST